MPEKVLIRHEEREKMSEMVLAVEEEESRCR